MSDDRKLKALAFFGDAASGPDTEEYQMAYVLAQVLAKAGYTVVNGGGPGVMEAATQGAESVGGDTLVVTFHPEHATGFEGRYLGNQADTEIVTQNYIERMFGLMEESDCYLIFKGGTGTISELGTAWVLAKLYHGHHKPFILVGSFWRPIIDAMVANLNIDQDELSVFEIADQPEQVLEILNRMEAEVQQRLPVENAGDEEAFIV